MIWLDMQRTPKNYDGIASPGRTIGEMLPEILNRIHKANYAGGIAEAWPEIIGPKMAPMTRALSFEKGILTVLVRSSTLYSLLCRHEKPRLLRLLQERFPQTQVRDISFRPG